MSGTLAPSTPTNRRLAGITAASVNGSAISVIEFIWDPANVENTTMASLSGVDGYDQKPVAPYISGKFRDTGSNSVTSFSCWRTANRSSGTTFGTSAAPV